MNLTRVNVRHCPWADACKVYLGLCPLPCVKLAVIFTASHIIPVGFNNILVTCTTAHAAERENPLITSLNQHPVLQAAQALTLSSQQQNVFPGGIIARVSNVLYGSSIEPAGRCLSFLTRPFSNKLAPEQRV